MADRTQTYLTSDWKIWTYVPAPGSFILDFSQLNDSATPLSATNGTIEPLEALIAGITIREGSEISEGIFSQPTPASMSVNLIIENFTATDANKFLVGGDIWATYLNAETVDNEWNNLGKNTPVFMGRISNFNVQLTPASNYANINIESNSKTQDWLNTLVPITKNTTAAKTTLINDWLVANIGTLISNRGQFSSDFTFASTNTEIKSLGEWLDDINLCNLSIFSDDSRPDFALLYRNPGVSNSIVFYPGINMSWSGVTTSSVKNNYSESIIFDSQMDWSGNSSPTSVTLTNYFNPSIIYQYGSNLNDSLNANNYSATLDVNGISDLTNIGKKMLSMTKKFQPISISTLTAQNNQQLTFRAEEKTAVGTATKYDTYLNPKYLNYVGQYISVTLTNYGFADEKMYITGRTIEVTPEDWTTTYNLWKGFTN
jgi:hypothetical protein